MVLRRIVVVSLCVIFSAALAQAAEKQADEPSLPDGLKGFSGKLQGSVVDVQQNGLGFRLKVAKVVRLWKGNKAKEPEVAVGKTLLINAAWVQADNGSWRPAKPHVKFIKSLKAGEEIDIEAHNVEGERLHILELSAELRER